MSADGSTALVAGPDDNNRLGAAWAFGNSGSSWVQEGAKLTAVVDDPQNPPGFANSVALSADGDVALVGSPEANREAGEVSPFARSGSTWTPQSPSVTANDEIASGGYGSEFGETVALSGDATIALVGGTRDNNFAGAAWTFAFAATVPGAPLAATATPGSGAPTVAFTPPASNGGAPISSYTVTASPGGQMATGTGSPITVPGLTSGTTYTFTVTATNSAGTGPASQPSNPVTPFTLATGGSGGGGPGPPDLALTLAAPGHVAAGGQATFALAVSDPAGMPVSNIHLLVTLPAGAGVDAASSDRGSGCTAGTAAGTLDCSLGIIYPPLVAHITITLTLTTPGPATLTATVSGSQVEKNTSNNTASATVQVDSPPIVTSPAPRPQPIVKKPGATVTVVGIKAIHLGKKPLLHVTVKVSKAAEVTLVLVSRNGKTVARWQVHLKAGTKKLALVLPVKARHAGRDTLRVKIGTGKTKTVAVAVDSAP